jgi:hypothetical protein
MSNDTPFSKITYEQCERILAVLYKFDRQSLDVWLRWAGGEQYTVGCYGLERVLEAWEKFPCS